MTALRAGLPEVPRRMRSLPIEDRGYPVPWFVTWIDGKPDFRVADGRKYVLAVQRNLCWLCGEPMGKFKTFVLGPMCAINRTTSEPPCHHDCAVFAATACPFMILPRAKRREANLPPERRGPAGMHIDRNPGATCLWTTVGYKTFQTREGGVLITVFEPVEVEWYAEALPATRATVLESINSGVHLLWSAAKEDGIDGMVEFENYYARMMPLLPA